MFEADTLNRTIWAGAYLREMERGTPSNLTVSEIIELSMQERVLTLYTAFLALEPSDTVAACGSCVDESSAVGVEPGAEVPADTLSITAFPNPFQERTTLEISFAGGAATDEIEVAIYDLLGRVVRRFEARPSPGERTLRLSWDGTSDTGEQVASGVYLGTVTTPSGRHTIKLVRIR